jgi:hypothetical protein
MQNVLRTHQNASPYMEFYVLKALYQMGDASDAEASHVYRGTPTK